VHVCFACLFACVSKISSVQSKLSPDAAVFEPKQQFESHSEVILE